MKASLNKLLRSYGAHNITLITEPIVGLLINKFTGHHVRYHILTKYAVEKGWVRSQHINNYDTYFFTKKGMVEILQPLQDKTCITGRVIR